MKNDALRNQSGAARRQRREYVRVLVQLLPTTTPPGGATFPVRARAAATCLLAALSLCGCETLPSLQQLRGTPDTRLSSGAQPTPRNHVNALIDEGLRLLDTGDSEKARLHFAAVLKLDPRNATAHFLLARVYQIGADNGDRGAAELAEVGYLQALEYDPSLWAAADGLGILRQRDRRYAEAREIFARAALLNPTNGERMYRLAVASYYAGDLVTARSALAETRRLSPTLAGLVRAEALIAAASNDGPSAKRALESSDPALSSAERAYISRRIEDWRMTYASLDSTQLAQAGSAALDPRPVPKLPPGAKVPRMVQIDVVMIRTEEIDTGRRGLNLLDALTLQYGRSSTRTDTRTLDQVAGPTGQVQRVITRAITIPDVIYSLNIANDRIDHAHVIARPTLVSTDGQAATFFSGEEVSLALPGTLGGSIADRTIGVSLAVTPAFISDEAVMVNVAATRSFINIGSPIATGTFQQSLQTTKQSVNTAVAMRFGETLILSGLSERQVERQSSSVPLLGDLPLIQYLFNQSGVLEYTKSVLILLTPRPVLAVAGDVLRGSTPGADTSIHGEALRKLYAQFPRIFKSPHNVDLLRIAVGRNEIIAGTRSNDIPIDPDLEAHQPRTLGRRLRELLYY